MRRSNARTSSGLRAHAVQFGCALRGARRHHGRSPGGIRRGTADGQGSDAGGEDGDPGQALQRGPVGVQRHPEPLLDGDERERKCGHEAEVEGQRAAAAEDRHGAPGDGDDQGAAPNGGQLAPKEGDERVDEQDGGDRRDQEVPELSSAPCCVVCPGEGSPQLLEERCPCPLGQGEGRTAGRKKSTRRVLDGEPNARRAASIGEEDRHEDDQAALEVRRARERAAARGRFFSMATKAVVPSAARWATRCRFRPRRRRRRRRPQDRGDHAQDPRQVEGCRARCGEDRDDTVTCTPRVTGRGARRPS